MRLTAAMSVLIALLFCWLVPARSFAQMPTPDGAWVLLPAHAAPVEAADPWIRPVRFQALEMNVAVMRGLLATAPLEGTAAARNNPFFLALPDPNGVLRTFEVVESPIMEPALAAQFPQIKTYVGQGTDDPAATLRMDFTLQGFHTQVRSPYGHWYIDPYCRADITHYSSYFKRFLKPVHRFVCDVTEQSPGPDEGAPVDGGDSGGLGILTSGPTLKTYRLACAATGEYTSFQGGSVALGQSAIVTAINRVTGVYETELAVRLTLVANNSSLVYTNAATDPYTNNDGSVMLGENQANITSVIGTANYDIGHVFSTGGGGIAGLGVVCSASNKARGVTGSPSPTGDPFTIDYVAHEMGHQFGANHAFNGINGSCGGGNRNGSTAYEPGSGTTIMNYAGICGADDIQPHSDAYFNFISLQEIRALVQSSSCGSSSSTGNNAPSVGAAANNGFAIPKGTPFALTATANDPNGDALTYCWEERDLSTSGAALSAPDNGSIPLFRSLPPTTSPTRTFPALSKILSGVSDNTEKLPQLSRTSFRFTVTARDNRAGGGGVERSDCSISVTSAAGPFVVTAPSSSATFQAGTLQTVTWSVANTTASPVNCQLVNILLSTDGGATFPVMLAGPVPNNGAATVLIPNQPTTTGRIKVQPVNNLFFNIAPGVVTITPPAATVVLAGTGANTIADTAGNGNGNGRIDPGESAISVTVPITNSGSVTATNVSGTLSSRTPTVSVTNASGAYPNLAQAATGSAAYGISVSSAHPCGSPIALRLSLVCDQISSTYDFTLTTGQPAGTLSYTVPYTGPVLPIPDNDPAGVAATLNVSGVTGTISSLRFRFDGSACTSAAGATTVGLDHTWVGDLTISLISPSGTTVTLCARPGAGGGLGSDGNNFCSTVFDDSAPSPIQSIITADAPYTGSYSPVSALSSLNGQDPNGTWTLVAVDGAGQDTGSIRAFSLLIQTTLPPSCDPPNSALICPTITTNPVDLAACAGNTATFSVTATGTLPLSFQWRRNGSEITGATDPTLTITNASPADVDSYDCIVTNTCGSAGSTSAALTVGDAPFINAQPSSATPCVGAGFTLTVNATGSPQPAFQWRIGGSNIQGATSNTYSVTNSTAGDSGFYDCVVSSSCGTVISNLTSVTVLPATVINSAPANATVCAGTSASFSVTASGGGTLSYQWRRNTSPIGGANGATLILPSVLAGDAGQYDCLVTASCGSVLSGPATLTVNLPPTISAGPAAVTACAGSAAAFSVSASGTGTLAYQWRRNGSPIGGANGASYSIAAITVSDAGSYDCVVTNTCGSTPSSSAALTVNVAPEITLQPVGATLCEGAALSLSASASGSGTLSYQWRLNGNPIGGATSPSYSVASVSSASAGSYDCLVTNLCSTTGTGPATVVVNSPPVIATQPSDATVCVGAPASLTVSATGTAPFTYQWRKAGSPIPGATGPSFQIPSSATSDAGSYDCVVTNACSSATSNPASITVNDRPVITLNPIATLACTGQPATLSVAATGAGTLAYQWRKDTLPVPGANSATLTLAAPTSSDAGTYDCTVTNSCGTTTSLPASVTVGSGPQITSPPVDQSVVVGQPATLTVVATGSGTPAYAWSKDGTALVDGGAISGATTATLIINPTVSSDSGTYTVLITDTCGSATGGPAALSIVRCAADFNGDGVLNSDDLSDFITGYFDSPPDPRCDFNADGVINADDLADYITAYFNGCS